MKRILLLFLLLACSTSGYSQEVALKNNLIYDGFLTPNLSLECRLADKWTLDTQVGANFFLYTGDPLSENYKTTKWSHWLVQPEVRYWTCEAFNGFFVGLHGHGGQMNVGGVSIPFVLQNKDKIMKHHRYEGYFLGAGLSAGYHWILSDHWSVEASVGGGYARIWYDKFKCSSCGRKVGDGQADYVGPTKLTLSLVYMLK